jgi:tRNA1(Val) A37 N6-methylase TrmN6
MTTNGASHTAGDAAATPLATPAGLTDDAFLGGRLKALQPEKGFRAGIDSVFLAAAVPAKPGEAVFEAGIGTGVAALCLLARCPDTAITGLELSKRYALIAEENAARNGMADRMSIIHGDLKEAIRRDLTGYPEHGTFAHAFANPPYFDAARTTASPNPLKQAANAGSPDDLELWVKVLHAMVAPRGSVTLVHRPDMLGRILAACEPRFGDIVVAPLYARAGMAASRIIVQGIRGARGQMRLLPGLILHGEGARFTPEAEAVLRHGKAWPLR